MYKILIISTVNDNTAEEFLRTDMTNNSLIDVIIWDLDWNISSLSAENVCRYEYIIIAIRDSEFAVKIKNLIKKIYNGRLIDLYACLDALVPTSKAEQLMLLDKEYEGIVLGISNAEHGIIEEFLPVSFCNLAVASQDIYYNYKSLEYCIDNFPEKFRNLKYVLFDLFDYTYINFDTSLSSVGGVYFWENGGFIKDKHHFDDNKNYSFSYADMIAQLTFNKQKQLIEAGGEFLADCIDIDSAIISECGYRRSLIGRGITRRLDQYVFDENIEKVSFGNGLIYRTHTETISENIDYLNRIFIKLFEINPNMKVWCLLLPQTKGTNDYHAESLAAWKGIFTEVMDTMQSMYPIELIDMKSGEMSEDSFYFHDFGHLNYYGAMKFTDIISKRLFEKD